MTNTTQITPDFAVTSPPYNGGAEVAPIDYGQLLADVERAARRLPPYRHISLLYDVLYCLQKGGMDVRAHIDCAMAEMD